MIALNDRLNDRPKGGDHFNAPPDHLTGTPGQEPGWTKKLFAALKNERISQPRQDLTSPQQNDRGGDHFTETSPQQNDRGGDHFTETSDRPEDDHSIQGQTESPEEIADLAEILELCNSKELLQALRRTEGFTPSLLNIACKRLSGDKHSQIKAWVLELNQQDGLSTDSSWKPGDKFRYKGDYKPYLLRYKNQVLTVKESDVNRGVVQACETQDGFYVWAIERAERILLDESQAEQLDLLSSKKPELTDEDIEDMAESGFNEFPEELEESGAERIDRLYRLHMEQQVPARPAPYHAKKNPPKKGDRVRSGSGKAGQITLTRTTNPRYEITWEDGRKMGYDLQDLETMDIRRES
jgi:hypothetical protein